MAFACELQGFALGVCRVLSVFRFFIFDFFFLIGGRAGFHKGAPGERVVEVKKVGGREQQREGERERAGERERERVCPCERESKRE